MTAQAIAEDKARAVADSPIHHQDPPQKTPAYAWVIWIVTFLISFAAPLAQFKLVSIPTYFIFIPGISPEGCFGLDAAGFGWLMTLVSLIGILLAFPAAFICRRIGLRNTIALSALGVIVGGLVEVLGGDNVATLMIGRFVEGTGIGLVGVAAPTLITLWFPEKTRGFALGLWCCWVPLSITLDSIVCPQIAASAGWQGVFWFVIAFAAVALVLFWVFYRVPEGEGASYNVEGSFGECMKLLKNYKIWMLGIVFAIFIAGQTGIVNTYLPTFLQSDAPAGYGWTEAAAGGALAVVTGIGLVSNPVGGAIMQKLPGNMKRIIPMLVAVLYMVTFYMLFQSGNEILLWTGVVLMGLCAGLGGGGLRPLAPTIMFQSAMAATMGMSVLQFSQCVGNCFSPIYGMLLDGGMSYLEASLVTMVPLSVVMLVCAFFIRPKEGKRNQQPNTKQ